jgi:cytochrome c oxidase subunit 2
MFVAIVLVVLVIGSILFHFLSPWWLTPIASHWTTIDLTIDLTFWVTGFVFVAVNLFLAYSVYRFRHNAPNKEPVQYKPENKKLEIWLTVFTSIGVIAMLGPGLYVWNQFVHVPEDAWEFEAIGEQWQWTFRLPGEDGKLGTSNARLVTIDNPLGVNPDDPTGQDDIVVLRGEVHIPIDKPVKVLLRSKDVLHDFAVPQFRVKMDLVPGLVTYLWFTPTRTGAFEILCEELCGVGHFTMRGRVIVDTEADYQQWLASQMTFKDTQEVAQGDISMGETLYAVCATCHGAKGEGNEALNSPRLAGQHSWYLRRQIQNFKLGIRGAHKDDEYGQQMAPMAAILVNEKAINDVSHFISTLPNHVSTNTTGSNVSRGEKLYQTCGICHGATGKGNFATNSPSLVGQDAWYLVRQLQNFKNGIRGNHPDDYFGPQMRSMSMYLRDEQAVNDVADYITTLRIENKNKLVAHTGDG